MRTIITESDRLKATKVVSQQVGTVSYAIPPDDYKSRIMKYIPSEVVVLYLTLDGIINSASVETSLKIRLLWLIFLISFIGTWIYLWRVEKVTKKTQLVISTIAFFVWAFTLGGPFTFLSWYLPLYGAILLPVYTFFVALIKPES